MFSKLLLKSLEWLLICIFGAMVLLVFGNVVLRYGFNYGIIFSEEYRVSCLSGWCFWGRC